MPQVLRLTVVTGPHRGEKFCFRGTTECLIGRAPNCFVQMAGTERDQYISRLHCRLALDASSLTLQDLQSRAGSFLDGQRIGLAVLSLPAQDADGCASPDQVLDHGSLLTLGGTTFRLDLVDCPPRGLAAEEAALVWTDGEATKKHCPWHCG